MTIASRMPLEQSLEVSGTSVGSHFGSPCGVTSAVLLTAVGRAPFLQDKSTAVLVDSSTVGSRRSPLYEGACRMEGTPGGMPLTLTMVSDGKPGLT